MGPFESKTYCDQFKTQVAPFIKEAIELGGIKEYRNSEILLAWVAGFASAKASAVFQPWTLEHTRRCFDLTRLIYETQSETS